MLEAGGRTRHPRKQFVDLGSLSGSNSAESLSHSASMPSTARLAKVSPRRYNFDSLCSVQMGLSSSSHSSLRECAFHVNLSSRAIWRNQLVSSFALKWPKPKSNLTKRWIHFSVERRINFSVLILAWPQVLDFPRQTSVAASTLPELTTRLDFFKKWRPQLMEQLHDLDVNYGLGISHDDFHRPSQPSWSWLDASMRAHQQNWTNMNLLSVHYWTYYLYITDCK